MSTNSKDGNGNRMLRTTDDAALNAHTVRLYCIRTHDTKVEFKLKADFGNKITLTFNERHQLCSKDNFIPFIYTLHLDIKMNDSKQLCINHKNNIQPIDKYHLIISRPRPVTIHPKILHQEKANQERELPKNFETSDYFLFDIHFSKGMMMEPPGIDTNSFVDLCLFTYYLLHNKQMYHMFDNLAEQFQINLYNDNGCFDRKSYSDFFETCIKYMDNILPTLETEIITLKTIVRMVGLLPIEQKNFVRYDQHANFFATKIMLYVRKQFNNLFQSVSVKEHPLFKSGLVTLLCIEFLYSMSDDTDDNKLIFLHQISDEKQRELIASELLLRLYDLNEPIYANSAWTDLFTIVNPNMIKLQEVYLMDSFETYIMFIHKVSPVHPESNHFYRKITEEFERLIYFDKFQIHLKSILFLIEFTQSQLSSDHKTTERLLSEIRRIIQMHKSLKYKIAEYFNNLHIHINNLEDIGLILDLKSKCTILDHIEKDSFLRKSLSESNSYEYYIKWFKCFLAKGTARDGSNHEQYKKLLKAWTMCFEYDCSTFTKILMAIDELIDAFEKSGDNDWLCLYFIDHIIRLCFDQKDIYRIIVDGLGRVQNEHFRKQFTNMYDNKYSSPQQQNLFRELTNDNGLLFKLIELDEKEHNQSMLVRDLIQVVCEKIDIKREDLMHDTFNKPTKSTSTYRILFTNSLKTSPLYTKTIERLVLLWKEWETDGFYSMEINTWKNLKPEQKKVACDIWNMIGEKAGKTIPFEHLIDKTKQQMDIIMTIIENVKSCINNYCQEAGDKTFYYHLLDSIKTQLDQKKIPFISVPHEIEELKPFADRLNLAILLRVWQKFFNDLKVNAVIDGQKLTCFTILKQATEMLDQFTNSLEVLYTNTKQPLLPQLEQLFPEKNFIDHELNVLKKLLNGNISLYLETLLEYWRTREHINRVCSELINFINQYNVPSTEKVSILRNILAIDNQASVEICSKTYQAYCAHYSKSYSEPMLQLIAQWSLSKELLEFLDSVKVSDVEDLLEVVNDWDETLINTKTVLDFVLLKRFLHQTDAKIESVRAQKSLELDDIIACFQKVWKEVEFKNILASFESCSKCLLSIKRICMGSANKELSKRRRILDIMKNSHFSFCVHQLKQTIAGAGYQFDVHIMDSNWEPISLDDLRALRDRARLIQHASNNSSNLQINNDDNVQQLQLFVTFVETIEVVLESLAFLNAAGYPVVKQYPMSKRKFTCNEGRYDKLNKVKLDLESQLVNWEKQLCTAYEQCVDLTYFSYQQLWMVENSLYKQTAIASNDPGYHLLKFIGINPQNIRLDLVPSLSQDLNDRLHNITQILNTQRTSRNFPIQEDDELNKKVFVIETSNKGILRAIYSLFNLNDLPIVANQLFYCTTDTNWMEIEAFIYRCFYSQTLHQLIQPELLSLVIQDKFGQLFNQLIEQNPRRFFLLSIITTVSISQLHIVNGLRTYHIVQTIHDQDMLSETALLNVIQPIIGDNCILITSRISGLGKSTYIRKEILKRSKEYIKFPITGDMDIDTLVQRLCDKEIQLELSPIAIHIDIGPIENVEQLNDFLYCLVLFRCFRLRQMPVHIPIDIPIYIELDSSSYLANFIDEIVILKYLKTIHLDHVNWDELNVDNSVAIQWVANYLLAIEDGTINTKNINKETITTVSKPACIRLLRNHFLSMENSVEFISWTQISIFITVYYKLFSDFSKCGFFLVGSGTQSLLRLHILKSLLDSSDQFTSLSVEKVRKNQRSINDDKSVFLFNEGIIGWDQTKPFTIIFTATYDPIFVYKMKADIPPLLIEAYHSYYQATNERFVKVARQQSYFLFFKRFSSTNDAAQISIPSIIKPEEHLQEFLIDHNEMTHEQFFLRLTSLSTKFYTKKSICVKCFKQYEYNDQQCTICPTKNALIRPDSWNTQEGIEAFQKIIAKKLQSEYVFTADNYIKMLLIYLRVQSGLPVLIMGETGCGKTALIQFLCQKLLNDEMAIFGIHAGVTSEKIMEIMRDFVRKAHNCLEQDQNKRLWVFFDEFNTTSNIGLLKEIVCERTLLGKPLPKNMIFLGACNPQRRKNAKKEVDDNVGIKKHYSETLHAAQAVNPLSIYSVVPIPETMLEYVWDYGYLDEATETSYVTAIMNVCEDLSTNQIWLNCIINVIVQSHKFFREDEDVSSVSLRDVARFCRFYNWFYQYVIPNEDKQVHNFSGNNIERASLNGLFLCYYFRLNSPSKRKEYMNIINTIIRQVKPDMPDDFLEAMLLTEKMALVNRMDLPKGTAKNRALTDNIFVLFTCILNKIPVILCGKPGSSKTSAVQIVISNLKGKQSNDLFFQKLPELVAVSYQGSQSCTSESVMKVFAQADKFIEAKTKIDLFPVIVFDEIGLAELSPHNPLKVLHSELEIEVCRHGFVGLSNWRLDASKINRALYLSCPEPDLDDLKITALTLSESMLSDNTQMIPLDDSIIQSLGNAYMSMCNQLKQSKKNQYYFGLRDYYALIKGIMSDLIHKNSEHDLYKIIRYYLSINFDGTADDANVMWSKFCEYTQRNYLIGHYAPPTFDELINQSISTRSGRFLMLIGDSESDFDYVQQYITIKYPSIPTRTLIGSTLAGDFLSNRTYTEQYNTRLLMDIILYAEKEMILFLRGLGHLYDNLYDLFNQNFAVSAKKKFCRIALGSIYHPRCVIHDNFYCVVFVKKQDLDKYDPPFLNRFEKHLININSLIHEDQKLVMSHLNKWINEILSTKLSENFPCSKHLFVEYSDDYIFNLVIDAFDHFNILNNYYGDYKQNVIKYCQDQMIRTSSFDFPLLLSLRSQTNHTNDLIQRYYEIHADLSFASVINQTLENKTMPKLLIYTYTQIYHDIDYSDIKNHKQSIEEVKLSSCKTELELIQKIKMYDQTNHSCLLCIRVDYHQEYQHIPMLKHLFLNEQILDGTRGVCLIFHLQHNRLHQVNSTVFFSNWSTVMIDNLQEHKVIPQHFLLEPSYQNLISHLKFLSFRTILNEHIARCFTKFRYQVTNKHFEAKINKRLECVLQQLTLQTTEDDQSLRSLIQIELSKIIQNTASNSTNSQFNDWRQDLMTNEIIIGSCRSFNDALHKTISFFLDNSLSLLLTHLEKHSLIDSYIFLNLSEETLRKKLHPLWLNCWTKTMKMIHMSALNRNNIGIPLIFDLHLPCATVEYRIIGQIREMIAQAQQNNFSQEKNWLDVAWKELISKSIYGNFINNILDDPDLFTHYYHDQLTLAKNEANIHGLSISFIQRLLTSKISGTVKDQLIHLLLDYEELFIVMQIFELGIAFIGKEDDVFEILDRQILIHNDDQGGNIIQNNSNLYYIVHADTFIYQIPPKSSSDDRIEFESQGNPFIEVSLMNLIELLMSPFVIDKIENIEQLTITYGLLSENMIKLSHHNRYEIINLEKFRSLLRLASSISTLFPSEKALVVFKQVYHYSDFTSLNTLDQIQSFISYLNNVIKNQQSIADNTTIQQTLIKLENELLRNWLIGNSNQYGDVMKFIGNDKNDRWKYAGKIFTTIDKSLNLSSTIMEHNGKISQSKEYTETNASLCEPDDPTRKVELLMSTRIYMHLILDENYQPRITNENDDQIIPILNQSFDHFKTIINTVEDQENEQKLALINFIAWLRYYLQYYVHALKNDNMDEIMKQIDDILINHRSPFGSTVKLFIIKQLCQIYNITFSELSQIFVNRSVRWIRSMIMRPRNQQILNAQFDVILPTPLFECRDEFLRINSILSSYATSDQLPDLIRECATKQEAAYSFIIWFLHHYSRFYMNNISPDYQLVNLVRNNLQTELTTCFELVGYQLILSLCTNFDKRSYFHLKPFMSDESLYQRLLVLNIIAYLLSFKSIKLVSLLGFLLYDENRQMPKNYSEHFKNFDCLPGVAVANDCALIQMINVRTQIEEHTRNRTRDDFNYYIIRCSSGCPWIFYFENYDVSNEQKQCPLCHKKINISQNEDSLVINPPHIQMNIDETLQFICQYIDQHKRKDDHHFTQPISYHFIHLITQSIFLFLNEFNHMPHSDPVICTYFQKSVETDYILIRKHLSNVDQCYVWIYKLINHMVNEDFVVTECLNSVEKVLQLERLIEEKLIIPHLDSVISEIREYKTLYADFVYGNDKQNTFVNFVDELVEDNEKYPLLYFFNVTNIHSINIIEDFHSKLQLLPDFIKTYPLTTFYLQRISDYHNIQYLYPIIKLTNYFLQHFNHHLKRNEAMTKRISEYLQNDKDLQAIYQQFQDSWRKINLKEIHFDRKKYDFQCAQWKYNFQSETSISTFLLNKSSDNPSILLVACLQTLANLQNDIVDYFYSRVVNYTDNNDHSHRRTVPIQLVQRKHLFLFDTNAMRKLLVKRGLMINYTYGMGKDIIYNYEEIEYTLRNEIGCLPLIDIKNMRFFNYQLELYDENVSLINDIRERFEQKLFNNDERIEIQRFVNGLDNDFILQLSGSLEYILTYLRTVNNQKVIENSTIETFINEYIHSKICTDNQMFRRKPFSTIHLKYIIDFYELIEESIFDKILSTNIRNELSEKSVPADQRTSIVDQFIYITLDDKNLADCLKDFNCWISMFKRLLVRLLSTKIDIKFYSPLEDFVKRIDMWKGNITKDNIQTITIKNSIQLKHAFIILKGLEANQKHPEQLQNSRDISQRISVTSLVPSSSQRNSRSKRRSEMRD